LTWYPPLDVHLVEQHMLPHAPHEETEQVVGEVMGGGVNCPKDDAHRRATRKKEIKAAGHFEPNAILLVL
jgi:hypothetical protein